MVGEGSPETYSARGFCDVEKRNNPENNQETLMNKEGGVTEFQILYNLINFITLRTQTGL